MRSLAFCTLRLATARLQSGEVEEAARVIVNGSHRNRTGAREEWIERTHKHLWSEAHDSAARRLVTPRGWGATTAALNSGPWPALEVASEKGQHGGPSPYPGSR